MNYFNLFQLPQILHIDKKKLINTFYSLQKKYHPDAQNHLELSKKEKLNMSIKINQGFTILKNKYTRAKYLLKLNKKKLLFKKIIVDNQKKWLIKQFQLHETIQNIQNNQNAFIKINKLIKEIKQEISLYFCKFEKKLEKQNIYSANKIFYQLSFIYKIYKKAKKIQAKNH
ncbi:Fe-S protein assembly co-chaperone HscB [Buchnera aphidicola]|uniref:Fe-S protein assembly co-chaperone HscB n=1 Tax=Buchnera aphidicola TaxID=9 RepID=UPI00094D0412|nr:Fe-S protein assembly co-chaperone HscB [Buchnera aphidicola]